MLEDKELARILATPIPTLKLPKRQFRQNRPKLKEHFIEVEATLQPIVPQKRQKTFKNREKIY